ncbi:MAG: nucleotidyltransferase domain-containing protein [Actinomycetota bacterium]|nr:nucleotidyltransferase domain-containing protein [Actinomycetota bacterium]
MRDPWEGLTADGMIRTGVRRDDFPGVFEPVVAAAVEAVSGLPAEGAVELQLYGSVATGEATPGSADVDLLTIGINQQQATAIGQPLSQRFVEVCRGVEIGAGRADYSRDDGANADSGDDATGGDDERYGNRVFLRHYCVSLYGPNALQSPTAFPGDAHAARGFNVDIGRCLDRWRRDLDSAPAQLLERKVARKTLLAVAELVSVHDHTWTTDRDTGAGRWAEIDPQSAASVTVLSAWSSGDRVASRAEISEMLAPEGIVAAVVAHFVANIGLWAAHG